MRGIHAHLHSLVTTATAKGAVPSLSSAYFAMRLDDPSQLMSTRETLGTQPPESNQVQKLQDRFGLQHVVVVGDRGMLTQTQIERLKSHPGLGWISALRSTAIRKLVVNNHLQMSLFDQKNLAEIRSDDFPGERLIACYNPLLAVKRRRKRDDLLAATEKELSKIAAQVARRTRNPLSKTEIAQKVGRVINRKKVAKHFTVKIDDGSFSFSRKTESILREQNLDGIYVIRTGEPAERISAEDAVRNYKSLQQVERAFRSLKGIESISAPDTPPHG